MLNNHEVNLTDEEAAAEVARVAKTYPVVRLLSADQIKSEPNCLLAGDRCPCLRQSSLEALAGSDEVSERLLDDGTEYRARLRPLRVEGEPHVLLMVRPIDEQEAAKEDPVYTDVLTGVRVYKDAIPHKEAIQMILDGKCGTFNPLLLDCLLEVQDRIAETLTRPADVVAFPTI